jgi:tetratricopeptide (TPR) repeat protein
VKLLLFGLAVVLLVAAPVSAPGQTPVETARGLLKQYQEDPARIDRARDLLEAAVAKGAGSDVPTLLTLARAWFLYGEERAKTDEAKVAAYERARDLAKRATELAPRDPDAHLWHAITLGSWSQAKGLLRSALALRDLRREVDRVLELDPNNIEAHIMAGSIARELPLLLGGDRKDSDRDTAGGSSPHLAPTLDRCDSERYAAASPAVSQLASLSRPVPAAPARAAS